MSPASGPPQEEKMFPAALLEDQEEIMSGERDPVVLGMPPFSSPDPETEKVNMQSVIDTPAEEGQLEGTFNLDAVPDEEKKAGDWVDVAKAAPDHQALDEVEERYSNSEADFKTVDDAIEKRRGELDEQAAQAEEETDEEG
jgi:hypothetical protein